MVCIVNSNDFTGGDDYNVGPYSVIIPAGETSGSFEISIIDDQMLENNESFDLNIDINTLPDDVTLGSPDSATMIIINDDSKYIQCDNKILECTIKTYRLFCLKKLYSILQSIEP